MGKVRRAYNRSLAQLRIPVEHVIRSLKIFRILPERFRSKRSDEGKRYRRYFAPYNNADQADISQSLWLFHPRGLIHRPVRP